MKYIHKSGLAAFAASFFACAACFGADFSVKSPDGKLEAVVSDGHKLAFSVRADSKTLLDKCEIAMKTQNALLGGECKALASQSGTHTGTIETVYGIRRLVEDNYNHLKVSFKDFDILVRAYNEAVAYRFVSKLGDGKMVVEDETLVLPVGGDADCIAHIEEGAQTSFEKQWKRIKSGDLKKEHSATLPFLMRNGSYTVALVESSVESYPALRVAFGKDAANPSALFVKYPKKMTQRNKFTPMVKEFENFIAKTDASREFPWRAFIVARSDAELADNDTVFKLAPKCVLEDTSWIKPGNCVWEWWNGWNLEGVDFKTGVNNETYRYLIDYAAENNIPYVLFDAGWLTGVDVMDMTDTINEDLISGKTFVDIPALAKYAHAKDVKIVLWGLSQSFDKYPQAFEMVKKWGADGLKIDFTDRDDQTANELYERLAKNSADNGLILDLHGCAHPAGLNRKYPNVVNFEGVLGAEANKWTKTVTPSHDVDLVFTRMLCGPMDYTPGGMRNEGVKYFAPNFDFPEVQGTRAHMMALFTAFYAPLQMMCDSATEYKKYPDVLEFLANTPTTWDDTKVLGGEIGKFVVIARRSGESWYIAGLDGGDGMKFGVDLSKILPAEGEFKAEIFADSVNSQKLARDYKRSVRDVSASDKIEMNMVSGGGFVMKISPKKIFFVDDVVNFFSDNN